MKWLYSGIGLALLNAIVFLTVGTNRIIGASTAYPYVADLITGYNTKQLLSENPGTRTVGSIVFNRCIYLRHSDFTVQERIQNHLNSQQLGKI